MKDMGDFIKKIISHKEEDVGLKNPVFRRLNPEKYTRTIAHL